MRKKASILSRSVKVVAGGAILLGSAIHADNFSHSKAVDEGSHSIDEGLKRQCLQDFSIQSCDVHECVHQDCLGPAPASRGSDGETNSQPILQIPCPAQNADPAIEGTWTPPGTAQLLGLGYDASKIHPHVLSQLLELNCQHNVEVHVLSRHGSYETAQSFSEAQERCYDARTDAGGNLYNSPCAAFQFDADPPSARSFSNRVDRIAHLRDYQRDRAYIMHQNDDRGADTNPNEFLENQAVVLVDLDMHYVPPNSEILAEVSRIVQQDRWDVICAAGLMHHPFGYYDIFATVLEDSTFVYPLAGRMESAPMQHENVSMIRSDPLYGQLTQEGLFHHFKQQAALHPDGVVPVKSCFGGLAVYRASSFFTEGCRYENDASSYQAFANLEDEQPCEHIIFHDCLRTTNPYNRNTTRAKIAIQPSLNTWWDKPFEIGSFIRPGGKIATGLVEKDGLVRSSKRPSKEALRLENGDYSFMISERGGLVIEDKIQSRKIWELEVDSKSSNLGSNWDFAFLTLSKDGEVILSHQFNDRECTHCFQPGVNFQAGMKDSSCSPCRRVMWSSGKRLSSGYMTNSFLHLGDDGILRVVDIRKDEILWQSHNIDATTSKNTLKDVVRQIKPLSNSPCIPSGTDEDINRVLAADFSEAVLCQDSTFLLKDTIRFTSSNQAVYTEGHPTGDRRATLRIADQSVIVAVNMLNRDHAVLASVVIDGNRPNLKQARGRKYLNALIQAGGRSQGQIISNIEAFETRSWSILHLAEGDHEESCGGALVEQNRLGPAGYHRSGSWADGISTACKQSLVRNNTIVDATDVALVLFGGPGSIIEDNHIIASTRIASAGITLVDFGPYDGNFSGSIVRRNTIDAQNATIGVGVAMGPRTWQCMNPLDLVNVTLWNATVTENILRGDHMQYGYAVDGVKNWTVTGNVDEALHLSGAEQIPNDCRSENSYLSPPAGFQINRNTSSGVFQDEFEDANIEFLIANVIGMRATKCIPSGDQDTINQELTGAFAKAVLCQGAVFNLSSPIVFTAPHQSVFTEGKPADGRRATLAIVSPSVSSAVQMVNQNYALLGHVIVDGNRPKLGASNGTLYKDALIIAGGESRGQVVRSIKAVNTRSWATLHLAEGDASNRCGESVVEDNTFGPAGLYAAEQWAVGISLACQNSWVLNNTIRDATDVGLSIFGAPGSIVKDNRFVAEAASSRVAISLVDYAPYDGDYRGTVIQNNTILALTSRIAIGIAMGPRAWEKVDHVDMGEKRVFGATVSKNILQGEFGLHAMYVAGVKNWTVTGNVHSSTSYSYQNTSSFQIEKEVSSGDFQVELKPAFNAVWKNGAGALNVEVAEETPESRQHNRDQPLSLSTNQYFPPFRIYDRWNKTFPCYRPGKQTQRGFFYAKIPRTGSTTIAGVARRIVANRGHARNTTCNIRVGHGSPKGKFDYGNRDRKKSFLWTFVREPSERALSSFFYHKVSKLGWEQTDDRFLRWAESYDSNYQTNFLSLGGNSTESHTTVARVLASYDFIGVTERMEESLVVLMILLDLPISDILYLSSKRNGFAFTSDAEGNLKCIKVQPKHKSSTMKAYLSSTHWKASNEHDNLLFQAANLSLDKTIERLGKSKFIEKLTEFREILQRANLKCNPITQFPCAALGKPNSTHDCYSRDEGCGFRCLDSIAGKSQVEDFAPSESLDSRRMETTDRRIVWLMSFPNSGTSYSQRVASSLSEISTATNYGPESKGELESIYPGQRSGPFWVPSSHFRPDNGHILTKNHCDGYCLGCPSADYIIDQETFLQGCTRYSREPQAGEGELLYSSALVSKGVHLFRDPFDNIVSRFNHERKNRFAREGITSFGEGEKGFRAFCRDYVDVWSHKKGFVPPIDNEIWELLVTVPCHTDFLRYIRWHNHASAVLEELQIPILVIHYEDYGSEWNKTVTSLLDFLEQSPEGTEPAVFKSGKTYHHYYFEHEMEAIRESFEKLSSPSTWKSVGRYFSKHETKHERDRQATEEIHALKPSSDSRSLVSGDKNWPRIVWLMSFPNSGTTYTQFAAASVSSIGTATNYGPETKGELESIFPGEEFGPYWVPSLYGRPHTGFVLTKNHCGGRCVKCPMSKYFISRQEFLEECLRFTKLIDNGKRQYQYPLDLVHKAVHLLRDPFDNIVSRYHHERKNKFSSVELQFYPNSPVGFRAFCRDYVDVWSHKKGFVPPIDNEIWELLVTVPCHTDFLRYIRWHNHASAVLEELQIPILVIHYEDYGSEWNKTVTSLLDFLEQSPEGTEPAVFKSGKTYHHYYFEHEMEAIRESFEKLSSPSTWKKLAHYLEATEFQQPSNTSIPEGRDADDIDMNLSSHSNGADVIPCTFDILWEGFGTPPVENTTKMSTCWKLDDHLLRVPSSAILNRNSLDRVDWPGVGTVNSAEIQLPNGTVCTSLIKVDYCDRVDSDEKWTTCVADGAVRTNVAQEAAWSTSLASFLFISSMKVDSVLPGLLPTWGHVIDSRFETKMESSIGSVIGAIPLGMTIATFDEVLDGRSTIALKTHPVDVAKLWLPLTEVLSFAEKSGFYFQDISGHNIFVISGTDNQFAIVHNATFLTQIEGSTCMHTNSLPCSVCPDKIFTRGKRRPDFSEEMVRQKDCERLLHLIFLSLKHGRGSRKAEEERLGRLLFESLDSLKYQRGKCSMSFIGDRLNAFIERFQNVGGEVITVPDADIEQPAPACTYEALNEAFAPSVEENDQTNSTCWYLNQEVLRLPVESIVDRHSMQLLGRGSQGVVHRATVSLGNGQHCSVAVKGDKCRHTQTDEKYISCIHPQAIRMETAQSVVDAEYIGSLLFHAAMKAGEDLPGFLPTWGLVYENRPDVPDHHTSAVALLMPLAEFETLDSILSGPRKDDILPTPLHMVELMMPVLKTLRFVENLGLSFQDVHKKNIGVITSSGFSNAFFYDSTHLTFLEHSRCDLIEKRGACDFCFEHDFLKKKRNPSFTNDMVRLKDCKNFVNTFLFYFEKTDRVEEELWQTLDSIMFSFERCTLENVEDALVVYSRRKQDRTASRIADGMVARLPFIFEIADYSVIPPGEKKLEALAWDRSSAWKRFKSRAGVDIGADVPEPHGTKNVAFNESALIQSVANFVTRDDINFCHGSYFNRSESFEWVERPTNTFAGTGSFSGHSVYIETNGTVTMVLDTCYKDRPSFAYFTLLQAWGGCTSRQCDLKYIELPGLLQSPDVCSRNQSDASFRCPCGLQHPVLWYDKPLNKWRMLMNQLRATNIDGSCSVDNHAHPFSGGYAETAGESLEGPWIYDYFRPAYGDEIRHSEEEGWRLLEYKHLIERNRPKVILGRGGGLDGGFLINNVCELEGYEHITNYTKETLCGKRIIGVARSSSNDRQRPSGTIYIQYHAETGNKTYPCANGPRGKARARHWISQFNEEIYKAPRTIIAPMVEDYKKRRGQRLRDSVTPLANHLGVNISIGPTLVDSPRWTASPATDVAMLALDALNEGTVTISYWSFTWELCEKLGTKCEEFDEPGQFHAINFIDGQVVSVQNKLFDNFGDDVFWHQLNETSQKNWQALGWDEESWNEGEKPKKRKWQDMNESQQTAASALGYNETSWNANCTYWQILVPEHQKYCNL